MLKFSWSNWFMSPCQQRTCSWRTWRTVRDAPTSGWSVRPASPSLCPPRPPRTSGPGWATSWNTATACCRGAPASPPPPTPWLGFQTAPPTSACAVWPSSPPPTVATTAGSAASWSASPAPRHGRWYQTFTPPRNWGCAPAAGPRTQKRTRKKCLAWGRTALNQKTQCGTTWGRPAVEKTRRWTCCSVTFPAAGWTFDWIRVSSGLWQRMCTKENRH